MYIKNDIVLLTSDLSNHPLAIVSSWAKNRIELTIVEVDLNSRSYLVTDGIAKVDVDFDCIDRLVCIQC